MRSIAKEAGLGLATVHRHFPERVQLREALIENAFDQIESVVSSALEVFEDDPEHAWRSAVHGIVNLDTPALAQALFADAAEDGDSDYVQRELLSSVPERAERAYGVILAAAASRRLCPDAIRPLEFHLWLAVLARPLPALTLIGDGLADAQTRLVDIALAGLRAEAEASTRAV